MHLARELVLAQTFEARMPQPSIARPLGEGDLRHELGLEPHRILALDRRDLLERRSRPFERLELAAETIEIGGVEPGADLAGINELAALEGPEQQRREWFALDLRAAEAADDELLAFEAFDLEPVLAAARAIKRIRALRHDAFEPKCTGLREELGSRALDIVSIDKKVRDGLRRHQL